MFEDTYMFEDLLKQGIITVFVFVSCVIVDRVSSCDVSSELKEATIR